MQRILSSTTVGRLHALAVRDNFAIVLTSGPRTSSRAHVERSTPFTTLALLVLVLRPHAVDAQGGRLEGTVTDSVHAAPVAEAVVSATRLDAQAESTVSTTADREGRFRFDSLSPGEYGVSFASPFLDSLEFGGPVTRVAVAGGSAARVALAVPSGRTLRTLACPGMALATGTGALIGLVTDADSDRPVAGAQVAAMWTELTFDGVMRRISTAEHSGGVVTDSLGQYRLCGVPTESWLLVQVQHRDRVGAPFQVIVGERSGVLLRNLSVSENGTRPLSSLHAAQGGAPLPPLTGTASLVGVVLNPAGQPVSNAQVRVVSTEPASHTDREGRFTLGGLPSGTQELEVRELGSTVYRQPVELRSGRTARERIVLRQVVSLDTLRTVASKRERYERFEANRRNSITGTFLTQEDIERRHLQQMSDLFNSMVAFRVVGQGAGARVMNLRGRCYPNVVVDYRQFQDINTVAPSLVAALEIYPTTNGAPAEFTNLCGVIRIWIKQ
jgi:hypothetical protein